MRYRKRIDENQPEIVKELTERGYKVKVTSNVGNGFPDLLVLKGKKAIGVEVKVKGKRKQLTVAETEMREWWLDLGMAYIVAESTKEIEDWFKNV